MWIWRRKLGLTSGGPRFLVIGAQKAGTTWLYYCLIHHPEIFLPTPKELHYFDANFHSPFRIYMNYFREAGARMSGEMTPCYSSLSAFRVAQVRQLIGSQKIIFLLRNPVERAESHALMELCAQQGRSAEEIPAKDFIAHFKSKNSILRTKYLRTYRIWCNAFGKENVYLDSYDRVSQCPETLLRDICEFLGVDSSFAFPQSATRQKVHFNKPFEFSEELDAMLEKMYPEEMRFYREVTVARLAGKKPSPRI
jgi:hypothetical protein